MSEPRRIVIGMTGASGVAYGIRALELLAAVPDVETHLVVTAAARCCPPHSEYFRWPGQRIVSDVGNARRAVLHSCPLGHRSLP